MALPTSPFNPAKSIFAGLSVVQITIAGDPDPTVLVFETDSLKHTVDQEQKSIEQPDTKGRLRKRRTVTTKEQDSFTFNVPEVKRLGEIFDGALAGTVNADVALWIPDPDDDTGKIALKSASFNATITRDGEVEFGGADFSKATVKIESLEDGPVEFTIDATV